MRAVHPSPHLLPSSFRMQFAISQWAVCVMHHHWALNPSDNPPSSYQQPICSSIGATARCVIKKIRRGKKKIGKNVFGLIHTTGKVRKRATWTRINLRTCLRRGLGVLLGWAGRRVSYFDTLQSGDQTLFSLYFRHEWAPNCIMGKAVAICRSPWHSHHRLGKKENWNSTDLALEIFLGRSERHCHRLRTSVNSQKHQYLQCQWWIKEKRKILLSGSLHTAGAYSKLRSCRH